MHYSQCAEKLLCTFHFLNCVTRIIPFCYCELEPEFYKPVLKYFLLERTQTGAFQFIRTLTGTEQKFEPAVELKPNLNRKN